MPEIPVLPLKEVKKKKNPIEKGAVFNSQNYDGTDTTGNKVTRCATHSSPRNVNSN